MTSLVVDIVPTPVATLVTIFGEADLATVGHLRERLSTVPDRDAVVEMSELALLSAVGLRVLLDLQDRLAAVGAQLVLAAPSHPVRRVLTVTELDARLPAEPTVADALNSLACGGISLTSAADHADSPITSRVSVESTTARAQSVTR